MSEIIPRRGIMAVGSINNVNYINSIIFKTRIRFVVNGDIKKQVVNIENNKVIREVPSHYTSQLLTKLYG